MIDDDKLRAIIEAEISDAMGNWEGDLSSEREKAMDYYYGDPYGDEETERSQIVTREMMEAVENAMPPLMRIFTASGKYVEFDPQTPDDIEPARIDTEAVRHIFTKQNDGFSILYNWMKDALRQKNGVVKIWYENSDELVNGNEQYAGITDEELMVLQADPELEIIEHTQIDQSNEITYHDVTARRTRRTGQVMVMNIPPEEHLISADARHLDPMKARFNCHRTDKTLAEIRQILLSMDYSESEAEDILENITVGSDIEHQSEALARDQVEDEELNYQSQLDRENQTTTFYECRLLIDYDEDGIQEYRKICYVAGGKKILQNVEAIGENDIRFRALSPFPQPHRFLGLSYFDMLEDVQHVQSILLRNSLNAIYRANENRIAFYEGMVDFDDLADRRFDGLIACARPPSEVLLPVPQQNIPPQTFDLMNRMDQIARRRTGVGEGVTGLDENALANAKTGVIRATQERGSDLIELIARVFAETGIRDLFRDIHFLMRTNHYQAMVFKMGDQFIPTNPSQWRERTGLTVNVGLGSGDKDRDLAVNREIRQTQQSIIEAGGMGMLVTPQNIYQSVSDLVEIAGKHDPSRYFNDPGNQQMPPPQQQGQEQGGDAQAQAYLQAKTLEVQAKMQTEQAKMQLDQAKQQSDEAMKRYQAAQKHLEKMTELELKYNTNVPGSAV